MRQLNQGLDLNVNDFTIDAQGRMTLRAAGPPAAPAPVIPVTSAAGAVEEAILNLAGTGLEVDSKGKLSVTQAANVNDVSDTLAATTALITVASLKVLSEAHNKLVKALRTAGLMTDKDAGL
jgi:hypothetical protein